MYATDVRQKHLLMPPPIRGRGINHSLRRLGHSHMQSDISGAPEQISRAALPDGTNDSCRWHHDL